MQDKYLNLDSNEIPVIDLSEAPGEREAWGRPTAIVYLWALAELIFITNPLQVSSKLRVHVLRIFGANIGEDVVFRPRTRVKFPWNLKIGDRSWIGEGVWIHNQDKVVIGTDTVISQDTFITTGSHAHRKDMALITKPVIICDGVWVTSKCVVTGGVTIGVSALVQPLTRVSEDVPANCIFGPPEPIAKGKRMLSNVSPGSVK